MPNPESHMKFKDGQKQVRAPHVIYLDSKTIQPPTHATSLMATTRGILEHVPSCFSIRTIHVHNESQNSILTCRGKDSMERLAEHLEQEAIKLEDDSADSSEVEEAQRGN